MKKSFITFGPCLTKIRLYNHRNLLETQTFLNQMCLTKVQVLPNLSALLFVFICIGHIMRKLFFYICKTKDANQMSCIHQHLSFCFVDSTTPRLLQSEISSFYPVSVTVQASLC